MKKIVILGSDSSHALSFAKLVNLEDGTTGKSLFPDCRIIGIYGEDPEQTKRVAEEGRISYIAKKPDELIEIADAAMVVFRRGDFHARYAIPFIEAGIPVWIDKPFTNDISDALAIIKSAKKNNLPLTGGSGCRKIKDVVILKDIVRANQVGNLNSAVITFRASLNDEYGGLGFYGSHLIEIAGEVFGYDIRSVTAKAINDNVVAILNYKTYHVILNFISNTRKYGATLFGDKDIIHRNIGLGDYYESAFSEFYSFLMQQDENSRKDESVRLLNSVIVLDAIVKSIEENREVIIDKGTADCAKIASYAI